MTESRLTQKRPFLFWSQFPQVSFAFTFFERILVCLWVMLFPKASLCLCWRKFKNWYGRIRRRIGFGSDLPKVDPTTPLIHTTLQCLVIFRNVWFCFMAEDDKSQIFVFLQTMASRRFLPHVFDFCDTNFLHYTFFSAQEKNFLVKFDKRLNWFSA